VEQPDAGHGLLSPDDQVLDRVTVHGALGALSPADRRLVELRYIHDWPSARIAETMALPAGTVRVRLHRARARMRAFANEV
jgi:RNA polymerase sigma factor (sigma-70 family)